MKAKQGVDEYLRRNVIHAASVGAVAGIEASLCRLRRRKRRIEWLEALLQSSGERATLVAEEVAAHRDEMRKYVPHFRKPKEQS